LLVGDIEKPQEESLLASGAPLRADVLLVPHHGSKTSSGEALLDAVQSGYRNRFGHPAAPVMQRYEDRHVVVRDSPHCGAAIWSSDARQHVECTRMAQMSYLNHRVP
jgi:competence protein ComEC